MHDDLVAAQVYRGADVGYDNVFCVDARRAPSPGEPSRATAMGTVFAVDVDSDRRSEGFPVGLTTTVACWGACRVPLAACAAGPVRSLECGGAYDVPDGGDSECAGAGAGCTAACVLRRKRLRKPNFRGSRIASPNNPHASWNMSSLSTLQSAYGHPVSAHVGFETRPLRLS